MPLSSRYYDVGMDIYHLTPRCCFAVSLSFHCHVLCSTSNSGCIITVCLPSALVFTVLFTNGLLCVTSMLHKSEVCGQSQRSSDITQDYIRQSVTIDEH